MAQAASLRNTAAHYLLTFGEMPPYSEASKLPPALLKPLLFDSQPQSTKMPLSLLLRKRLGQQINSGQACPILWYPRLYFTMRSDSSVPQQICEYPKIKLLQRN